jgi:hypothetical protein
MADEAINIKIEGLDKLIKKLGMWDSIITDTLQAASIEASNEVLNTQGLRAYPPETAANRPPEPYYIRGRGTQYKSKNDGKSERYGTQFYTISSGYSATIGNRASYAEYLTSKDDQAEHMAKLGWRKLWDVAMEKQPKIQAIYQGWVNRALKMLGLE